MGHVTHRQGGAVGTPPCRLIRMVCVGRTSAAGPHRRAALYSARPGHSASRHPPRPYRRAALHRARPGHRASRRLPRPHRRAAPYRARPGHRASRRPPRPHRRAALYSARPGHRASRHPPRPHRRAALYSARPGHRGSRRQPRLHRRQPQVAVVCHRPGPCAVRQAHGRGCGPPLSARPSMHVGDRGAGRLHPAGLPAECPRHSATQTAL